MMADNAWDFDPLWVTDETWNNYMGVDFRFFETNPDLHFRELLDQGRTPWVADYWAHWRKYTFEVFSYIMAPPQLFQNPEDFGLDETLQH